MIQLALRQQREYVLRGLMTPLGISLQIFYCDQGLELCCACLFLRVRTAGRLSSELSVLSSLCQDLFLTVHMKDQLAGRAHLRLGAEIELSVCEGVNRSDGDAVHHVEVLAQRRKRLLVYRIPPHSKAPVLTGRGDEKRG